MVCTLHTVIPKSEHKTSTFSCLNSTGTIVWAFIGSVVQASITLGFGILLPQPPVLGSQACTVTSDVISLGCLGA